MPALSKENCDMGCEMKVTDLDNSTPIAPTSPAKKYYNRELLIFIIEHNIIQGSHSQGSDP